MGLARLLALLVAMPFAAAAVLRHPPLGTYKHAPKSRRMLGADDRQLIQRCKEKYRDVPLDHFSWDEHKATFKQRYFVCDEYWKKGTDNSYPAPIFFYLGNEADVTLYLNHSGLMWENAPSYGALLVFAEHRYYGNSLPFPAQKLQEHMGHLTAEQAMADYAELIWELKEKYDAPDSAVVGFGGSYGGMLAAWFRLKYPHLLDGAIAASAPIWAFLGETPPVDAGYFARGVTFDASAAGGSAPACVDNVRRAWALMEDLAATEAGRVLLQSALRVCPWTPLEDFDDVLSLRWWLSGAWDYLAMGDYPYASTYITNGDGALPPFPVRAACAPLADPNLSDEKLLDGLAAAAGVFYNFTGADLPCFDWQGGGGSNATTADADFWDWQYCTEMLMPMTRDGVRDMFWAEDFDVEAAAAACREHWGVVPRKLWATVEWGGRRIETASNIVFSNGRLDPWAGGGVLQDISDSLVAVIIDEGAHHLDLMFSHPDDPPSVKAARRIELQHIDKWIREAASARATRTRVAQQ